MESKIGQLETSLDVGITSVKEQEIKVESELQLSRINHLSDTCSCLTEQNELMGAIFNDLWGARNVEGPIESSKEDFQELEDLVLKNSDHILTIKNSFLHLHEDNKHLEFEMAEMKTRINSMHDQVSLMRDTSNILLTHKACCMMHTKWRGFS